jgi:hypothetical protein
VPLGTTFTVRRSLTWRMEAQCRRAPVCFKDPRFASTLDAWRPYVGDAVFVCVFRDPARTCNSIVKGAKDLSGVTIAFEQALRTWALTYLHVLEHHERGGRWVFVHYDQVLDGTAAGPLSAAIGAQIDTSFPDRALRRSAATGPVDPESDALYRELCSLAGFRRDLSVAGG